MHDATMGNMLVCHGRRGRRTRRTDWLWFRPGRKEEEREEGRGMLGALCWNFLVADMGFLPKAILLSEKSCSLIQKGFSVTHNWSKFSISIIQWLKKSCGCHTDCHRSIQRRCRRRLKEFPTRLTCFGMWEEREARGEGGRSCTHSVGWSSGGSSVPRIELSLTLEIRASMNWEELLGLWDLH